MDGNIQFFEGYNYLILYSDAQFGLPLYADWQVYSGISLIPEFFQASANFSLVDTSRGLRLRFSANYSYRKDSLAMTSGFAVNDTIFGRNASEEGRFYGFTASGMKLTRKFLGFLRLYAGAEIQLGLSPRSTISLTEYSYDIGEGRVIEANTFAAPGKARFNLWGRALVGLEAVLGGHYGLTLEVKSGLGTQFVLGESSYGLAANAYHIGLSYYFWDFTGRPARGSHRSRNRKTPSNPMPGA